MDITRIPRTAEHFINAQEEVPLGSIALEGRYSMTFSKPVDNPMNFPCQQRNVISVFIPVREKARKQAANLKTQHDPPETSPSTLAKGMQAKGM